MTIRELKRVTNSHIKLMFTELITREEIDLNKMTRAEKHLFNDRHIYMIFPTEQLNTFKVVVY